MSCRASIVSATGVRRVEPVDLVQVDVVGAQAGQGGVDLLEDGLAGQAGAARAIVHSAEYLGGQHDVLAT